MENSSDAFQVNADARSAPLTEIGSQGNEQFLDFVHFVPLQIGANGAIEDCSERLLMFGRQRHSVMVRHYVIRVEFPNWMAVCLVQLTVVQSAATGGRPLPGCLIQTTNEICLVEVEVRRKII